MSKQNIQSSFGPIDSISYSSASLALSSQRHRRAISASSNNITDFVSSFATSMTKEEALEAMSVTAVNLSAQQQNYTELLEAVDFYLNERVGLVLFVTGIVFNIMSFVYFQLSRSFRHTSMRHYFSVLSISDSLRLSEWLFTYLVMTKKILTLDTRMCQIFLFVTIASAHVSIWLLVFLSIERYIILRFPFRGKQFYSIKNSLIMLVCVIVVLIAFNVPYLMPQFIKDHAIWEQFKTMGCLPNDKFWLYMHLNTIVFYSLVPFFIILFFNCLLICLLARQKTEFHSMTSQPMGLTSTDKKRDRQFIEKTILLMLVTFFMVITVSPRYIAQMINIKNMELRVIVAKVFMVLEMLNFSLNFLFYILGSKTSRNEFKLIMYYFFYWIWTDESKTTVICNHVYHNPGSNTGTRGNGNSHISSRSQNTISAWLFKCIKRKNTKLRIHCYLNYATRQSRSMNDTQMTSRRSTNTTNKKQQSTIRLNKQPTNQQQHQQLAVNPVDQVNEALLK